MKKIIKNIIIPAILYLVLILLLILGIYMSYKEQKKIDFCVDICEKKYIILKQKCFCIEKEGLLRYKEIKEEE